MSIRVTTIIPAYNAERTIAQSIDSALAQDYEDHEIVVVNDGSTDLTTTVLDRYKDRIKILSATNGGPAKARNLGVANSSGKYLAFLDADDLWLPKKLNIMVTALEQNPSASLAFSECRFIDKDGIEFGESSFRRAPSMDELLTPRPLPIFTSTWVVPRLKYNQIGGFEGRFPGPGLEDTWVLLLLRELGQFVYVSERLTLYRQVQSSVSADKYGPGTGVFVTLLKERYGAKGKRWIRNTKNSYCGAMLSKLSHQMSQGDGLGAAGTLASILWFRPTYFFGSEFRQRVFLPRNIRRLYAAIFPGDRQTSA